MGVYFKVVTINLLKTETAFKKSSSVSNAEKGGREERGETYLLEIESRIVLGLLPFQLLIHVGRQT